MEHIVVVGGGIAGLLAANLSYQQEKGVCGIERSEVLGGDLAVGHHRFYDEGVRTFFSALGVRAEWKSVEEVPEELRKGKMTPVATEEFTSGQKYFLGPRFLMAKSGYAGIIAQLEDKVGTHFQLKRVVKEIELERRLIRFVDESEMPFEKLIWCQSLDSLFKAVKGAQSDALLKSRKAQSEEEGGVVLDMQFKAPFTDKENTVVLPFRFKDDIYRAFGNRDDFGDQAVQFSWTIFLDDALLENHEEVAKCVRTFKREFFKQFPQSIDLLLRERIVYLPLISSGTSVDVKKLELFPGVFYLGPQVRLKDTDPDLHNLDLLAENCRRFAAEFGFLPLSAASAEVELGSGS